MVQRDSLIRGFRLWGLPGCGFRCPDDVWVLTGPVRAGSGQVFRCPDAVRTRFSLSGRCPDGNRGDPGPMTYR
eukprot:8613681-Pyramimonas_sp.AAC.1